VKEQGRLVEQVYRADLPGLHATRLEKAVNALETAAAFAETAQREALLKLARALRSGSPRDAVAAQEAAAPLLPKVDAVLGFVGGNADPRGVKALWLGLVGFRDEERTAPLRRLAAEIGWFELRAPWPQEFKRRELALPAAEALVVASAAGAARPEPFLGLQLVPGQRGRSPGKAVLVPGLEDAAALARDVRATAELAPPHSVAELIRCRAQLRHAAAALHEVIGHAGAPPSALSGEHAATLEEARAEVLAHFHMQDPKLVELGLITDPKCQPLWPQLAAVGWLSSLALVPEGDRVDSVELRAEQLQLWWFTQRHAVMVSKVDGRTVLSVPDAAAFHKAAGNLLSMLRTIQATGDAALLRGLVDAHAARLDTALRDEVLARFEVAGIPRRVAALPPNVRPVLDGGHVIDARIEPVKDLDAQILEDWAEF
jgi:dipeptidyl-peptidase-3